jgi:conjugative relaxase-like TrwC/TraI family protein
MHRGATLRFRPLLRASPSRVLSIGKLGRGQEGYYLSAVALGVEDYYTGEGEAPGEWLGAGAARLGLSGQVDAEILRTVLGGKAPDGSPLSGGTRRDRVPGWDLTFSAPKSVSVLYGLGGPDIAGEVVEAHRTAVLAGIEYLERHALVSRRRIDGTVTQVKGTGVVIAGFRHRTSRAGDPQLHTHCLAANVVEHDAGWGAIHSPELYRHARTAGFVYQAVLRGELSLRLGVEWGAISKGMADIKGIDPELLRTFSKRRIEIEAALAETGGDSPAAAEVAALVTRRAKSHEVDPEGLTDRWAAEAKAGGLPLDLEGVLGHFPPTVHLTHLDDAARHLISAQGLTRDHASFDRKDVVRGWCEGLPAGAPLDLAVLEELTDGLLEERQVIPLAVDSPQQRWSTVEMLNTERRILERAADGLDAGLAVVDGDVLDEVMAKHSLSDEQAAMVDTLCSSGRSIDVVVGRAGTGKTYALAAATDAWRHAGLRPIGLALAARAAAELESSTGMPSTTVAQFLIDSDRYSSGALTPDTVLVIDEAGMVDTRRLARILAHADAVGVKSVLVGDHHQLPAVEAGGAFDALVKRHPHVELTENHRQIEAWERAALDQLREGHDIPKVLDLYDRNGRLHIAATPNDARASLAEDWFASRKAGNEPLMLALRHSDVHDLNARARSLLVANGDLPGDSTVIAGKPFVPGDEIVCLQNDRRLDVHNALFGTVTEINQEDERLELTTRAGEVKTIPYDYVEDGHLSHAYATTIHKAQGATFDHALLLGDDRLYRQAAYTALSRGRIGNDIYAIADPSADRDVELHAPADIADPIHRLEIAFSRDAAEELAIEQLDTRQSSVELDFG